jgi:sterol-4alpha-carboxylate 3-dehydrogenase (decarboxylating)
MSMYGSLGTVLVTGGSGGLASQILQQLSTSEGTTLHSIDIKLPSEPIDNVTYHLADLTDCAALRAVFENVKPEVVFHTASPRFDSPRDIMYAVNVEGTEKLVKVAKEFGTQSFIYTSSASVISDGRTDLVGADETYPLVIGAQQPEYYTHTKALAESFVLSQNGPPSEPTFQTCALRPSGIIGVGDLTVLPGMVEIYYAGRTKVQLGSNRNLFDFTANTNVAHAHCLAATKLRQHRTQPQPLDPALRVDGEVFIITNDEPRHFWSLMQRVWQIAGDKTHPNEITAIPRFWAMVLAAVVEWVFWIFRLGDPPLTRTVVRLACMTRWFCIDKAKKRLGYETLVSLDEALVAGVEDCIRRREDAKRVLEKEGKVKEA